METERSRKRDSAHKKSDFSVYSQKAVRAKERLQRVKPVVIQKSNDNESIGQKSSVVKVKNATNHKKQLKNSK